LAAICKNAISLCRTFTLQLTLIWSSSSSSSHSFLSHVRFWVALGTNRTPQSILVLEFSLQFHR
jgi:hypothetical protein